MHWFGLLLGHLVGDYLFQNDWQAGLKTAQAGLVRPGESGLIAWFDVRPAVACTIHCLLYTLAVWLFSVSWMPWWGLLACFAAHWPMDRFRLARRWMALAGQEQFATGPCAPWSIIVVDNTVHLLTLYVIALAAGLQ